MRPRLDARFRQRGALRLPLVRAVSACALLLITGTTGLAEPLPTAPGEEAAAEAPAGMDCAALASQDLSATPGAPTEILSATVTPAGGGLPEYCSVKGYVVPQVQFEMRLPTTAWNGKYFQTGCGGFCGSVPIASCNGALARNYAVAAENTGHVGGGGDALWALDRDTGVPGADRELEVDFGYRAPHVVSLAA